MFFFAASYLLKFQAKLVDPYEQLPRNTSSKNIRDRSDTFGSVTFAASKKESSSPEKNSTRKSTHASPTHGKHSSKNPNTKAQKWLFFSLRSCLDLTILLAYSQNCQTDSNLLLW